MTTLEQSTDGLLGRMSILLNRWEEWLYALHQDYLAGRFDALDGKQALGLSVIAELREVFQERRRILEQAKSLNRNVSSLRELIPKQNPPTEIEKRFLRCEQQLHRLKQQSLSLWVLAFQCCEHTVQLLHILCTGEAEDATYGSMETESLGGGRLVDQAA